MPLRIAFIRYRYDPFGGAERFTQVLVRSLAQRGAEVHVFARKWADSSDLGVRLHRIGGPGQPALLGHISFALLVARAVRRERFDLVQSNERTLCQDVYRAGDGVHARWLELRCGRAGWLRRLSMRLSPFHLYRLWIERRLFESPELKAVIVNSEMVRGEILSRFRVPEERIHTIYNGVDLTRFHPGNRRESRWTLRQEAGAGPEVPVVLFVGSGFERKGLAPLLVALSRTRGESRLWVVGKGRTRRYEALAGRLGIRDRVTFWGPRRDVAPFYAGADLFVLPTLYDPFPSVVLEAMASGLPVITTAQCGAAEILREGEEGFVIASPFDTALMASRLEHLACPEVRRRMSGQARRRAEAFPIERTIRELEALYAVLLGQGAKRPPAQ